MLRKTLISLAVSSALYMSSAQALELGELTSQSRIDEPYRGRIEVTDAASLDVSDISVRLGSESEFRQAGLTPTRTLSQLSFEVVRENGELAVLVQSEAPLEVDQLNFVLAARWPSGQVVREYQTPINQSALVEKAQPEVVQSVTPSADQTPNNQIFRDQARQAQELAAQGEKVVERGNTLWSIAGQSRPNNQLTIYQTMMAIQALNEDAFYANNINLLREGAVLRLPTQEQIQLFNRATSQEEFERQHAAWMALKQAGQLDDVINQEQMNTQAASNTQPAPEAPQGDQLRLASNQSALPEAEASSNEADQQRISELESELSATNELLDKETREKAELNDQLTELNDQLATLERLISLKDQQMAELQRQFTSAQQAMQEQKNTVDQLLEADQLRREREAAEEASWTNKIFGNPIVLSVAGVVLLLLGLLIGMLIKRSGRKKDQAEPDKQEFDLAAAAAPAAAVVATEAAVASEPKEEYPAEEPEEHIEEEDPFAFDFEVEEPEEESFAGFDEAVASSEVTPTDDQADEFGEFDIPELEEVAQDSDIEDALGADMDELADDEEDNSDPFSEFEVEDTDIESQMASEEDPLEALDLSEPESETAMDLPGDEDAAPQESLDDTLADLGFGELADEPTAQEAETPEADYSEEEDFVNSLLTEAEDDVAPQADVDETAVFDSEPDAALADSIDEVLAEAQQEEEDFGGVEVPEFGAEQAAEGAEELDDDEENIDFFDASGDEVATKLDLARAYMDMGDEEGARVILEDVVNTGNESQIAEAQSMMERMFPSE
ncbi:FimV/HubP family polar landmark protein [Marinomonas ostreistagni]|uniref:FimV/HubP family polar landmark protein n=1 Tax=Marinomonas ostreistagni TaxID=359209 RepID=UPI00194DEB5F|nr:FimV/HubP family polar landmark protein [Marinomonas ostreistagni]MBM6550115.1 pilus assembly protein FimV [Marinomonas ostreistagni]